MDEKDWEIIRVLLHPEASKKQSDFYKSVIHHSLLFPQGWKQIEERIIKLKNLKVLSVGSDGQYYLSDKGKEAYASHTENQEIQEVSERKAIQKLELEIESLVSTVADYAETKQRSKDSITLSRISAGIALIALLIQWLCKKPH